MGKQFPRQATIFPDKFPGNLSALVLMQPHPNKTCGHFPRALQTEHASAPSPILAVKMVKINLIRGPRYGIR
jgi:hypothetical protein